MVKTRKFNGKIYKRRDYVYEHEEAKGAAKSLKGYGQLV